MPLLLLLACRTPLPDTVNPGEGGCFGPALWEPLDGATATFRHPPFAWSRVQGATDYTVEVTDSDGDLWVQAEVRDTAWRSDLLEPGAFTVTVTANPGGESCSAGYTVRTLGDAPTAESAQLTCGRDEAEAIETSWAVAVVGGTVFATLNAEDVGVCAHDADTLAFEGSFGSRGERFRTFGAASSGGVLYFDTFPFLGECGDTLRRLAIVDDPEGAREVRWVETGMESGVSVAVGAGGGVVYEVGLAGASCYGADSTCLDLDEPCPNGVAGLTGYDLGGDNTPVHREEEGSPGLAADDERVYRAGPDASVVVTDNGGEPLFELPTTASPRGLIRYDADGAFLLVTDFDQQLTVYELLDAAPTSADDLLPLFTRALPDRYWQGAADDVGRFYWPGQLGGRLARWDLQ